MRLNLKEYQMNIRYLGTTERYSEAVCAGGFVFLSGMVPENPEADAKAQTKNVLAQIDRWLEECGSDKAHIRNGRSKSKYPPCASDWIGQGVV